MWPFEIFGDPAWRPMTWTLLHFLWQGMLVAAVWKILLWLSRTCRMQTRYLLGLAGMVVMAACPVATLIVLESSTGWTRATPGVVSARPIPTTTLNTARVGEKRPSIAMKGTPGGGNNCNDNAVIQWIGDAQPYLLCGWIAGLLVFSGRLLLGVAGLHWLGRGRQVVTGDLAKRTAALAQRMGIDRIPGMFGSSLARQPAVIGFLRPFVLLPVAWLTEMTPEVLEAVIAHELAHIRRHDLWVNLFQRIVETLLFYHPAIWWLSRQVRLAREMCCDEMAAAATGNRVVYATALELAARRRLEPCNSLLEVALGINQMTLLSRVRNVLGLNGTGLALSDENEPVRRRPGVLMAMLASAVVLLIVIVLVMPSWGGKYTARELLLVKMQDQPILAEPGLHGADRDRFEVYKNTQQ